MSDHNRPRENRLKREFKEMPANGLRGANHPHDERPGGSRLEFMTPTPADGVRKRSRLMFTRAPKVMGEDTSPVCLQCTNKLNGSFLCLRESQNVMQGAHNFVLRDSAFYVAQNVCPVITALMV